MITGWRVESQAPPAAAFSPPTMCRSTKCPAPKPLMTFHPAHSHPFPLPLTAPSLRFHLTHAPASHAHPFHPHSLPPPNSRPITLCSRLAPPHPLRPAATGVSHLQHAAHWTEKQNHLSYHPVMSWRLHRAQDWQ